MFNIYKKNYRFYGRIYPVLILCLLLGLMQEVVALVEPQIISLIVDRVINPAFGKEPVENTSFFMFLIEDIPVDNLGHILGILIATFVVFLLLYFVTFYARWNIAHYFSLSCDNDLRLMVLKKINGFGPSITKEYSSGDLITIVNSDSQKIRNFHVATIPFIIDSIFYIVIALVILSKISLWLTVFPLLTLGIYLLITKGFLKLLYKMDDEMWAKNSEFNTETQESIYGIRTIKSYGREDMRKKRFYDRADDLSEFYTMFGRKRYKYWLLYDSIDQIVLVVSMAISIALAVNLRMTSGEYAAFIAYMFNITGYFIDIIFLSSDIQDEKVSTKRLHTFLEKRDLVAEKYGTKTVSKKPHIELKNVVVNMEDEKAIVDGVSIDIPYGKKIGLMGKTGCGKSVIIKAMQAFVEHNGGEILFDGTDSREYDRGEIARAFGYAMQDVFLFSNTIESNIAYYNPDADEELIRKCGRAAEVDEFAENFADGYQTIIGEKGFGLSGGQKQRVAIARALLKDAPVIVLDDCTSALDMETESKIFKNLEEFFTGKSIVMATHRAKALKNFDEIIYMEDGKVAERGTFDELMALDGHYASIYKQQMDKEALINE